MHRSCWMRLPMIAAMMTATLVGGCQAGDDGTGDNKAAVVAPSPTPSATAAKADGITAMFRRDGPDVLSTVGLYEGEQTREVKAAEGTFSVQPVDGIDTLLVNGKPAFYQQTEGVVRPEPITANSGLHLVGVFELPEESVAWALITGGTACPGNHVLVPVRNGVVLPGQSLPGCDDRGTMRRAGDRIVFEAGGSTGSFQNDMLTVDSPDAGM